MVAGLLRPRQCTLDRFLVGRGQHGVGPGFAHHTGQRGAPGHEDLLWQAEGRKQAALAFGTQAGYRAQAQPVAEVVVVSQVRRGVQGLRTASPTLTGPSVSITRA